MGVPTWTLIGMGSTFIGAFVMIILAYIAQSPGFAARIGLGGTRIAYQVKTFTGYALALMLLFSGFFLAGVPLDPGLAATAVPTETAPAISEITPAEPTATLEEEAAELETNLPVSTPNSEAAVTPASGAFGGPPPNSSAEPGTEAGIDDNIIEENPVLEQSPGTTGTPVTSTPIPTRSPTPTATATPTLTPTPIDGETAVLNLGGSVTWLRRSPGGQNLVVLQDNEVVILQSGHANRAGIFWREVATGNGTLGWVEEQFLKINEN